MGRDHWSVRNLFSLGLPSPERARHTAGKTRSACCPTGCQRAGVLTRRLRCEPLEDRRMLSVLMVDADAPAAGDGLAWATALNDLQPALTQAATLNADPDPANDIDSIWIAEGTYKPSALLEPGDVRTASFSLVNNVALHGGFSGVETALEQRDWTAHPVTLSGDLGTVDSTSDNAYTVVYCGSTITAMLDGVSITEGNANGTSTSTHPERGSGAGIYTAGTLTVANCTLSGNSARGGGAIFNSGILSIVDSLLSGNAASSSSYGIGGGVYSSGTLTITNSTLSGNSASISSGDSHGGNGGGIYSSGDLTIIDSTLSANSASSGSGKNNVGNGGGVFSSGTLTITHSMLSANSANSGTAGYRSGNGGGVFSSGTLTILDSTLSNNSADSSGKSEVGNGGGIYSPGPLTITRSTLSANRASSTATNDEAGRGGGICGLAALSVTDCLLLGNSASYAGGGIEHYPKTAGSDVILTNCTLLDNFAGNNGGGITCSGMTNIKSFLGNCTLSGNSAGSEGGGASGNVMMNNCTLASNSAGSNGGGVSGSFNLTDCSLFDNSAGRDGGGIYGSGTLTNCSLSNNSAGNAGGGVFNSRTLRVTNCTLSNNRAGGGGGIYNSGSSSTATLNNTIVAGNNGSVSPDFGQTSGTLSGSNNLIGDGSGQTALVHGVNGNLVGTPSSPIDPLFGDWTRFASGLWGYSLLPGSPALDVGNNDLATDPTGLPLTEDIAGNPRVQNGVVDMGAVEGAAVENPAQTYVVTSLDDTTDDDGVLTFREAFEAANSNQPVGDAPAGSFTQQDIIRFADGVSGTVLVDQGQLTVMGDLRIEGSGEDRVAFCANDQNRVFYIWPTVSATLVGIAITHGSAEYGGGILNLGSLTVVDCEITDNSASSDAAGNGGGGGIYNSGTLTITDSTLDGNSAIFSGASGTGGNGGGIYNSGTLTITDSTLDGNSASHNNTSGGDNSGSGGGIYNSGTLTVTGSTLSTNAANGNPAYSSTGYGGGIYSSQPLVVTNSVFSNNSARMSGGGICGSTATITGTILSGNSAGSDGGGISGDGTLTDCTLSGNSAGSSGGGIHGGGTLTDCALFGNSAGSDGGGIHASKATTLTNCTLSGNSAVGKGGGIFNGVTLKATNCTIVDNWTFSSGGGILFSGTSSVVTLNNTIVAGNRSVSRLSDITRDSSGTLSGSNNLIGDGSGQSTLVHGVNGNLVGTSSSPIDPLLGHFTQFANGRWGYDLLPGSPALDAGNNDLAIDPTGFPLTEDLADGPRVQNDVVDMGAVEGATIGAPAQTYVVTSLDDTIAEDGVLTFREAFEAANSNQPVGDAPAGSFAEQDVIRFADGVTGTLVVDDGELTVMGDLRIEGPGATMLTLDANRQNRVFCVWPTVSTALEGVAITHGSATHGGGILNFGSLIVMNCRITDNSTSSMASPATNSDRGRGGGIWNAGTLTIVGSTFSDNSAVCDNRGVGGVIGGDGGGVFNTGTLIVTRSTFSGNSAGDHTTSSSRGAGGAIYSSGSLTVMDCAVLGNTAVHNGGGICNSGAATIVNSTLSSNYAFGIGGGVYTVYGVYSVGAMTVANSTISGNTAGSGGGIYLSGTSSTTALNNTIVADNRITGTTGPDVYRYSGTLSGSNNLIGDGSGQTSLVHGVNGNLVGTSSSPIDPMLSDLSRFDTGMWGYHLLPGSPALDAGNNDLALDPSGQPLTQDIAGNPRIQNGSVDIGAVEGATAVTSARTFLVTSLGDTIAEDGVLTFREAFEAANGNLAVGDAAAGSFTERDIIQFADGVNGTISVENGELAIVSDLSIDGPGGDRVIFDAKGQNRVFCVWAGVSASFDGITITGGSAEEGGGIFTRNGVLVVTDCDISGNSASVWGGGICVYGTLMVADSRFSNNSAGRGGGGIRGFSTVTVTNCTFSGNSANATDINCRGGGIYSSGTLTVVDSRFFGNSSSYEGGGISSGGDLTILNSLLSENSATEFGGGISPVHGLTVANCTIWNNTAGRGGAIGSIYTSLSARLYNTIVAGNSVYHSSGSLSSSYCLIGVDAKLDSRGVPLFGSPAINKGSNALAVDAQGNPLATDLDGNPRIVYGTVDIGAFEYRLPGDVNLDAKVGEADAQVMNAHWMMRDATWTDGDVTGDGQVDGLDAAVLLAHWGERLTPRLPGDANDDGTVNDTDAAILAAHWLMRGGVTWDDGDFNTDGVVDDRDAAILAAHWVRGTEAAPVEDTPNEPTGNGTTQPVADEPISDAPISNDPISNGPVADEPISDAPISDEPISNEPAKKSGSEAAWMSFVGPRRPSAAFIGPVRASGVLLQRNDNAGLKLAAHDAALAEGLGIGQSDDATSDNETSVLGRRKLSRLLRMPLDPAEWLR